MFYVYSLILIVINASYKYIPNRLYLETNLLTFKQRIFSFDNN